MMSEQGKDEGLALDSFLFVACMQASLHCLTL